MKRTTMLFGTSFLFCAALYACGHAKPEPLAPTTVIDAGPPDMGPPDTGPATLYTRLGGKDGVAVIVEALVDRVVKDPKLKGAFVKLSADKMAHFKQMLNDQICSLTEGPCTYTGKDMRSAHKGMNLSEGQWNAFVSAFGDALKEAKVEDDDQGELLLKIAPMKDEVLGRPSGK